MVRRRARQIERELLAEWQAIQSRINVHDLAAILEKNPAQALLYIIGDCEDARMFARDFAPSKNEDLRMTLGADRAPLVGAIERWLPFAPGPPSKKKTRWVHALEEIRKGLDTIEGAVKYLGDEAARLTEGVDDPRLSAHDRLHAAETGCSAHVVRFFMPLERGDARAFVDYFLGPPRRRGRRLDDARIRVGARLAGFFESYGETVTMGRHGLFATALQDVLTGLGFSFPTGDPLPLLRQIRAARQGVTKARNKHTA